MKNTWRITLTLVGVLCLLGAGLQASEAKAQTTGCLLQDPLIDPGTVLGMHDLVKGGWAGIDMTYSGQVRSIFADGGNVIFAQKDGEGFSGGGNGVIIRGNGACSNMVFAAWHDNNDVSWIKSGFDPQAAIMSPGITGNVLPRANPVPHNHVSFITTEKGLCGIPDDRAWSEPGTSILGDAWAYDVRDVSHYCGASSATSNSAAAPVVASATYYYPNYGNADARYNIAYYWYMVSSEQTATTSLDSFSGSFVFKKGVNYYANAMGGGSYDKAIGYHCVGNCEGVNEGMAVCDAISTLAKFASENTNGCIVVTPASDHGSYIVPEAGPEWSIAVTAPKGTPLTRDPTAQVGGADVKFYNKCDQDITLQISGSLSSITVETVNGSSYTPWVAKNASGERISSIPIYDVVMSFDVNSLMTDSVYEPQSQEASGTTSVASENATDNTPTSSEKIPIGNKYQVDKEQGSILILIMLVLYVLVKRNKGDDDDD